MKAMRLDEPAEVGRGPLRQAELPVPQPRAGQVLIRVRACGVCHTDLHTVEGELPLPKLPVTPGHEVIGVVEARADGAERFNVGQRVGVAWLNSTCGKCRYCRDGRENLCPRARFTGYHVDGGYGEYLVIDEVFAYEVPEGLDDVAAAPLLCAGI
ncbi:MAG: alcohol dehydrogenase catalytic domain-containing protein, partial [Phycisphaerae bacterium]